MNKAAQIFKNNLKHSFSKKQITYFLASGIVTFFLFLLFTLFVRADILRPFDFNTTVRLQDNIPVKFDEFFSFLSVTGRFEFSLIILLTILFLKRKILGIAAFIFFGFAHVIELIGKTVLSQPGPPHMFLRTTNLSLDFPGLYIHTKASYPSGHSLRVVFLSVIIILLIWSIKKLPAFYKWIAATFLGLYTFLMLLSRVSLGEHWMTDVIGGTLLGLSFALLSLVFL